MRFVRPWYWALAITLALTTRATAQAPAVPAAPAAPAQAGGIVGLCQLIDAKIQACKAKICACPLGQLITSMQSVMNLYTGGLICPPCCPTVNPNDLNKPSDSAAGACARFRKDTEEMKARRDAVRCLAYADCHWWPEAEAALINSLRTDRNECVRLEAAKVLTSGCCCTKKTLQALTIVVSGSNRDGNPSENSPRVRAAALAALHHCLDCYSEVLPEPQKPEPAPPPAPAGAPVASGTGVQQTNAVLRPVDEMTAAVDAARQVLAHAERQPPLPPPMTTGNQSVFDAVRTAATPPEPKKTVTPVPPPVLEPPPTPVPVPVPPPDAPAVPPTGSRSLFGIWHQTRQPSSPPVDSAPPPAPRAP
jgi:hypothetical protein